MGDRAGHDPSYPTCKECYATLRVYHDTLSSRAITALLGLLPDETRDGYEGVRTRSAPLTYWGLTSREKVDSKDLRDHLDFFAKTLEPAKGPLKGLIAVGATVDLFCFWASASGHGGPTVDPSNMLALGRLGIPLAFDLYYFD